MKKVMLSFLGVIIAFIVFRFFIIKINNYTNANECNSSRFVANGERIYLHFISLNGIKKTNSFLIIIKGRDNKTRQIQYLKDKVLDTYFTDDKILKDDTLIIKNINSREIKVYDFKNEAKCIMAGKRKGQYYCTLLYKDNFHNENYYKDDSESINYISINLN